MPASRMTLPSVAISALTTAVNCSGVLPTGSMPAAESSSRGQAPILATSTAWQSLMALTTAVTPDAPCILQWDDDFARNPVAGYSYPSGSPAAAWNLPRGWHPVSAIVNAPWNWSNNAAKFKSRGDYVVLVIPNARECRSPGLALFPEDLRSELHPVRAVIEAHSARTPMQGQDDGDCCGIGLGSQSRVVRAGVRVLIGTDWTEYIIDRWE